MNSDLEAIVKVIAYGVPALLILLGFLAYVYGHTLRTLTGDVGMANFGVLLIVLGIILYVAEVISKIYMEAERACI